MWIACKSEVAPPSLTKHRLPLQGAAQLAEPALEQSPSILQASFSLPADPVLLQDNQPISEAAFEPAEAQVTERLLCSPVSGGAHCCTVFTTCNRAAHPFRRLQMSLLACEDLCAPDGNFVVITVTHSPRVPGLKREILKIFS